MTILILFSLMTALPDSAWQTEYRFILEGLNLMNLDAGDLEFGKHWIPDDFRLPVVRALMDNPLLVPDYVFSSARIVKQIRRPEDFFLFAGGEIADRRLVLGKVKKRPGQSIEELVREVLLETGEHLDRAFQSLNGAQRDSLIFTAPTLWADDADSLFDKYQGAIQQAYGVERDSGYFLETVEVLRLSKAIDVAELNLAGAALCRGVERLIAPASELKRMTDPRLLNVEGVEGGVLQVFNLGNGALGIVGGPEDNVYRGDFAVIIDPGGDDQYLGRAAAGIGEYGARVSFVLDLAGDDQYRNRSKIVNQGSGIFGCGLLWDLAGNDCYSAFHVAQGAGLYGTGGLIDETGVDFYRAGYFVQGAGNFGTGVLADGDGDDVYRGQSWAQGAGGPRGYGLVADAGGDDIYYTGGEYLHQPLDPDQYRSFSQGFGFGWRDIASGGIGFLYDRQGNDKYLAEVYGQATSYWFALGILCDEQGNDLYSAAQYAQGAGIHFSVGGLVDREGDDHYFSRFGPAQGEGHDLGVGWLLDQDGNDVYYASGGQGIGLTNSVGIFVDTRGGDDYGSREPMSQGGVNWARGTGGIGLFLDLEGDDRYAEPGKGADNRVWTFGVDALGMDLDAVEPEVEAWQDTIAQFPELDTMSTDSAMMARLFNYASLWEVGTDIGKVRTGQRLLKANFGPQAVGHIFKYEFATYDGLVRRAIENIFKEYKDTATVYLLQGLGSDNDTILRNSIYFLGMIEAQEAADTLAALLENKSKDTLSGLLAFALGKIKARPAVPALMRHVDHRIELTRLRVAVALAEIADTLAVPALVHQLADRSFLVKAAARAGLAQMGTAATRRLTAELAGAESDSYRALLIETLIENYRKLGTADQTADLKKTLAAAARPHVASRYAPLQKSARALIAAVEGRGLLTPAELFSDPRTDEK